MADKIDQLTIGSSDYDIDLPVDNDTRINTCYTLTGLSTVAGSATSGAYKSVRWYTSNIGNDITAPYDGMKIMVKVPLAGVGTAGVILSINGNNDDDYHPVAYNVNSVLTTHYPVNTYKIFVYDATATMTCYKASGTAVTITGVWKGESNYDSNTTTTYGTLDYYFRPYVGANRITRYKLVALDKDNRAIPMTTEQYVGDYASSTTYAKDEVVLRSSKFYKSLQASNKNHTPESSATWWQEITPFTPNSTPFKPNKIWFLNTSSAYAASSVIGGQVLNEVGYSTAGCTYNFSGGIPAYRLIYLRGTYNRTTGLFTLDTTNNTSYFTSVPDNTANITLSSYFTSGKDYILVGATYSSANYFQLFIVNTMYHFDGTNLLPYDTWDISQSSGSGDNQTIKGNGTTFNAGDAIDIVPGANVSVTAATTGEGAPKITIAATYSDATTSASGLMSASDKTKLNGIATGAEVNVQSDWNQTTDTADDFIKNKPTLGTAAAKDVGTSSGNVPVLDSTGKLAESVIPAVAITDTYEASSQAAMLALSAQKGDICIRSDLNKSFVLQATPASTLANWKELKTPTDAVLSVKIEGTSPISSSNTSAQTGSVSTTISLADGYGDTKNPYSSKTKNYVLAAPKNANGAPSFRALDKTDLPTLTASDVGALPSTTSYLASASASGNTLTITPSSGSNVTFTPSFTDHNQKIKVSGQTSFGDDDEVTIEGSGGTSVTKGTGKITISSPNITVSSTAGVSDGTNTYKYTLPSNVVQDSNYAHITVTSSSVSDGTTTFNKLGLAGTGSATTAAKSDHNHDTTYQAKFGNQDANKVYAGPSSGSAAAPSFRSLVKADLPTLTASDVGALASSTKYAGASTAGGAASSAEKLTNTSKIGDTNKPVYFTASGIPAEISYTIGKSVPSDAVFTDTATAVDDILDGSNTGTAIKYAPYTSKGAGHLYTGTTAPSSTNRLNYDGYFYATALYKGSTEVKPITINTTNNTISDGTNTFTFGSNAFNSTTIPIDSDLVHKGTSSEPCAEETIYGVKYLKDGIKIGDGSYRGGVDSTYYTTVTSSSDGLITTAKSSGSSSLVIQDTAGSATSGIHSYFKIDASPGNGPRFVYNCGVTGTDVAGILSFPNPGVGQDRTIATTSDITITGIQLNGTTVSPSNKVVNLTNVAKTNTTNTFTAQQIIDNLVGSPLNIDYDSSVSGFMCVSDDDNQATTVFKTAPSHNTGTITFPESGTLATTNQIPTVTWRPIAIAGNNILGPMTSTALNFVNTGNVTFSGNSSTGVSANVTLPQIDDWRSEV